MDDNPMSYEEVPDNRVIIFKAGAKQKETGSGNVQEPVYAMVETGRPCLFLKQFFVSRKSNPKVRFVAPL